MDIKLLVVILAGVILLMLLLRNKQKALLPFLLALFISILWTAFYRYEYVGSNIFLLNRINVYPLVLWTTGLTILQLINPPIKSLNNIQSKIIFYYLALASVEALGYHFLNIRLASNFTSLLDLGIIHAPLVMKIFYLSAGPIYLLLLNHLQQNSRSIFSHRIAFLRGH